MITVKTGCIGQFVKSSRRKWTDEKGMRIILYSKSYNKYIEEIVRRDCVTE